MSTLESKCLFEPGLYTHFRAIAFISLSLCSYSWFSYCLHFWPFHFQNLQNSFLYLCYYSTWPYNWHANSILQELTCQLFNRQQLTDKSYSRRSYLQYLYLKFSGSTSLCNTFMIICTFSSFRFFLPKLLKIVSNNRIFKTFGKHSYTTFFGPLLNNWRAHVNSWIIDMSVVDSCWTQSWDQPMFAPHSNINNAFMTSFVFS